MTERPEPKRQYAIRELNQQTAKVLARVEQGETVIITSRGKPIARIVPVSEQDAFADWVACGKAIPATNPGRIPMPTGPVDPHADAGELISRLRDEERW